MALRLAAAAAAQAATGSRPGPGLRIWILDKCDIACDIASLRYLSDISCDNFFIAFAISFISYAITNNIAYDIALRYHMRYPYDAISFILHAISHCNIVSDIFAVAYCSTISQCNIACDFPMMLYLLYHMPYLIAISHVISHAILHAISL